MNELFRHEDIECAAEELDRLTCDMCRECFEHALAHDVRFGIWGGGLPAVGDDTLEPLRTYLRGHATGDPAHFREAFVPTARIEGIRDGAFVSWSVEEYCGIFTGRPAPDEATRSRRIDTGKVHGTVGTVSMTLRHGADTFTTTSCSPMSTATDASRPRSTTGWPEPHHRET